MSDALSPNRRSKRVRSGSNGDGSEASQSPTRMKSPDQKRNKNGTTSSNKQQIIPSLVIELNLASY